MPEITDHNWEIIESKIEADNIPPHIKYQQRQIANAKSPRKRKILKRKYKKQNKKRLARLREGSRRGGATTNYGNLCGHGISTPMR